MTVLTLADIFAASALLTGSVPAASVLARSSEPDYVKLVFFAIVGVIWIISAIVKAAGKQGKTPQQTWTGDEWQPGSPDGAPPVSAPPPTAPPTANVPPPAYVPPLMPVTRPSPLSTKQEAPAFRGQQAQVVVPPEWLGQARPAVQPPPMQPAPYVAPYAPPPVPQEVYVPPPYVPQPRPSVVPAPVESVSAAQPAWGKVVTGYETARAITAAPAQAKQAKQTQQREGKSASTTQQLDAAAIRRWMTPSVMKQQFILTEMFDPPPSARPERQ